MIESIILNGNTFIIYLIYRNLQRRVELVGVKLMERITSFFWAQHAKRMLQQRVN